MKGLWYVADIGSWERGRMFIFKEKNDKAALRRAFQQVKGDAPRYAGDVVQLRRCGLVKPKTFHEKSRGANVWDQFSFGL